MNEFLIQLQAKLDELKSKDGINSDIIELEEKINSLKIKAELDSKSLLSIKEQLEQLANQTIKLSNINIDQNQINNAGKEIGKRLGTNIDRSLQSNLNDVKQNINSILKDLGNNKLSTVDLSKMFNLDRASLDSSIKEKVRGLTKEINSLAKEVVTTGTEGAWDKLLTNLSSLNKVLSTSGMYRDISSFKESLDILDYFQNKKIFVGNKSEVLLNTGSNVKELNNQFRNLGVTFTTVSKGSTKLDSIWSELFNLSPNLRDITSYSDQLNAIVEHLKTAKNAKFGENNLMPVNSQDVSKVLIDWLSNVEKLQRKMNGLQQDQAEIEQRIVQQSNNSTENIVNNEYKKQKEYENTAKAKQKFVENSSVVKSPKDIISFENTSNAAEKAKNHFQTLLESERAVVSTLEHIDENNNLESFTVKIKRANGAVEKLNYELNETGFNFSSGSVNNNGIEKQFHSISASADRMQMKLDKLRSSYSDLNAPRSVKDEGHLSKLSAQYNNASKAVETLRSSDNSTFASMISNVQKETAALESMISQFRNAENVATSLRSKNIDTVKNTYASKLDILVTKMKSSGLYLNGFQKGADNLKSILNNSLDASGLVSFLNGLDKLEAGFKRAQASAKAFNQEQKVEIKTSGLESRLAEIQRISPEIVNFKTQIGNAEVSIESLLNDLSKVSTNDSFGVVKERVAAFENAAKAAGFTIDEVNLKTESLANQVNKIQLMSNGGIKNDYSTQIEVLSGNFRALGLAQDEVNQKLQNVNAAFENLKTRINQPFDENNYNEIISLNDKLQKELAESENEYKKLQASTKGYVSEQKRLSQANTIEAWNKKNSRATSEVIAKNNEYVASLRDLNSQMTNMQFNKIVNGFKQSENAMRGLGKIGASLKAQMSQAISSLGTYFSASAVIMKSVSEVKKAVSEIKELDNTLTEISKTSGVTRESLEELGMSAYDSASKYGRTASDYLTGVQEMARSGFYGNKGTAMAEQSLLAQAAGDMSADVANQYILATNAAYKFNGEAEKLNAVLDGQNMVCNRNSVALADMAAGMSKAGTVASSYNVSVEDLTAMIGTMEAVTKSGGEEVGNALKSILINLQNVTSSKITGTLSKANASMTEFVNGAEKLRNPIEILRDLAETFNKLDEDDPLRAEILTNVGGKYQSSKLAALLQNVDMFDKMLVDYSEGSGSAMEEAEKSANNLTGTLNKLSNSWTELVNTFVNAGELTSAVNVLNNILQSITNIVDKLGSLGTIGLGAGLFASFKNTGKRIRVYAF